MGTKNNPAPFDCYAAAEPDEPMFVLLGRDKSAATLVRLWALLRHREKPEEDAAKIAEALACAATMDKWQEEKRGRSYMDRQISPADALFYAATEGMSEHPEDFENVCDCNLCRSYGV